ncbi:MAG: TlpA family protein disulfide reductase [Acidobacteriales bacterium]|nr:TlpA family protein disulfide reductase [Terriglobales bacterium]
MLRRSLLAVTMCAAAAFAAGNLPRKAPEFVIKLPNGGQKLLSQYRGKVVVMEFLLTTCPHCKGTSRLMTRLQADYGSRGLVCLGVAINDGAQYSIPAYVKETGANFLVGYSDRDPVLGMLQHPANKSLLVPRLAFIDRHGMFRFDHGGGNDDEFFKNEEKIMRSLIEQMLGPAHRTPIKKK